MGGKLDVLQRVMNGWTDLALVVVCREHIRLMLSRFDVVSHRQVKLIGRHGLICLDELIVESRRRTE